MTATQVMPATSSADRMHVLDESCWCEPRVMHVKARADEPLLPADPPDEASEDIPNDPVPDEPVEEDQ